VLSLCMVIILQHKMYGHLGRGLSRGGKHMVDRKKTVFLFASYILAIIVMLIFGYLMGLEISKKPIEKQPDKYIKSLFWPLVGISLFSIWFLDKSGTTKYPYWKYVLLFTLNSVPLLLVFNLMTTLYSNVPILYVIMLLPSLVLSFVIFSIHILISKMDEDRSIWRQKKYYLFIILLILVTFFGAIYVYIKNVNSHISFPIILLVLTIIMFILSLYELNQTVKKKQLGRADLE